MFDSVSEIVNVTKSVPWALEAVQLLVTSVNDATVGDWFAWTLMLIASLSVLPYWSSQ